MSEPFLGEIILFAGNFAPRGWAFCQGQIMSISQNTALFSILGTTYGGNGQTTFALPDLRGRVAVGQGSGPGLPAIVLGQISGEPTHTLLVSEMPAHNHPATATLTGDASNGSASSPAGNIAQIVLDSTTRPPKIGNAYTTGTPANPVQVAGSAVTVGLAGGNQPHNNMQPYLGLNYIIAVQGMFPSRN